MVPCFVFEVIPTAFTSFPRRRESPGFDSGVSGTCLHQTEDSRLRGSDVKVFEVISSLFRHTRATRDSRLCGNDRKREGE